MTQDRLSRLGCSLLRDDFQDPFGFGRAILEDLVPRLSFTLPSVNAAAAAVGAYYELQTSPSSSNNNERLAAGQYELATRLTQQDLLTQPYGSTPLLVGCMLLAFTELLLRRRQYALMHLRGAYKILELRSRVTNTESTLTTDSSSSRDTAFGRLNCNMPVSKKGEEDLELLFRSFDVQTAIYSDGNRAPDTKPAPIDMMGHSSLVVAGDVHSLDAHLVSALHACYHFTSFASSYTDPPTPLIPQYLLIEQGRHIGVLKCLLKIIDNNVLLPGIISSSTGENQQALKKKNVHMLMLRNLCLSTIMYTSTVLNQYETAWDIYADDFQQIVTNAEIILDSREGLRENLTRQPPAVFKFIPSLGVCQPLYQTALRYRHPIWRRRAIRCLRRAGREGPWVGELLAAVTERAAEIEENGRENSGFRWGNGGIGNFRSQEAEGITGVTVAQGTVLSATIPERARIRLCRMAENNGSLDGKLWLNASRGVTKVKYTRCRDVEKMYAAATTTGPKREGIYDMEERKQHWEEWSEILEFESDKPFKLLWSQGETGE